MYQFVDFHFVVYKFLDYPFVVYQFVDYHFVVYKFVDYPFVVYQFVDYHLVRVGPPFFSKERSILSVLFRSMLIKLFYLREKKPVKR